MEILNENSAPIQKSEKLMEPFHFTLTLKS